MVRCHAKVHLGNVPNELIEFTDEEERAQDAVDASELELAPKYEALGKIRKLETIPRRIRENLIALGIKDQVVIDEDAAIAVERDKL